MDILIANLSPRVPDAQLAAAVASLNQQVSMHLMPEWGRGGTISSTRITLAGPPPINSATSAVVYLGDKFQDPTGGVPALAGYHQMNFGGIPYAFVYLDTCAMAREAWSIALSHEILEMLVDPNAMLWAAGAAPGGIGPHVHYALDICDPTQGDVYPINNVPVSNFVNKCYFGIPGGAPRTNYLNLPLAPFGVRPRGYVQYGDGSGAHTINGMRVTKGRLAARKAIGKARRNARRIAVFKIAKPTKTKRKKP